MTTGGDKIDVEYVARLARLALSQDDQAKLSGQLDHVLDYVGKLSGLKVDVIEPTAHAMPLVNVFRKDLAGGEASESCSACPTGETRRGLSAAEALKSAPQRMNDLFIVPRVIEE